MVRLLFYSVSGTSLLTALPAAWRVILGTIGILGLALALTTCSASPDLSVEKQAVSDLHPPNIVWIVTDELKPPFANHIKTLVKTGISFTETFVLSQVEASARSALLTGVHPTTLGVTKNGLSTSPPAEVAILPERLRRSGYYTSRAGPMRHNLSVGVADKASAGVRPQLGLLGAWDVAGTDADWRERSLNWDLPCTVSFGCGGSATGRSKPFFAMFNVTATSAPALDQEIGKILNALDADALTDNTVVFLLDTDGTGTSLIVRWPDRLQANITRDDPVSVLDLAPTVLALAGVSVPSSMPGRLLFDLNTTAPRIHEQRITISKTEALESPHQTVLPPTTATPNGYPTGGVFHVAPSVELWCETPGSTIIYTTEREAPFYWRIYTGPFRMRFWTLRFQCGRLGYRDSEVVTYNFDIE